MYLFGLPPVFACLHSRYGLSQQNCLLHQLLLQQKSHLTKEQGVLFTALYIDDTLPVPWVALEGNNRWTVLERHTADQRSPQENGHSTRHTYMSTLYPKWVWFSPDRPGMEAPEYTSGPANWRHAPSLSAETMPPRKGRCSWHFWEEMPTSPQVDAILATQQYTAGSTQYTAGST